jgi:hypothetical protein
MSSDSMGIVSVIGVNLLEPILVLVEKLESTHFVEPNEVKALPEENGYSCAIVTLNVLLLESAINRTKYVRHEISNADSVDYFAKVTSDSELAKDIDEVVAIRDAVVHNHLWEADIYWSDNYEIKFSKPPKLLDGFGNGRQRRVIDSKTMLSRRLKLNLFPIKISRNDAYKSLRVVERALEALEAKNHNYFTITNQYFKFRGDLYTLKDILAMLPNL